MQLCSRVLITMPMINFGNFDRNLSGKVCFGFFRLEYSGSPLDEVHFNSFGRNIPPEIRRSNFDKPVPCHN